jgi:methionyl-tRNA formyltransferase
MDVEQLRVVWVSFHEEGRFALPHLVKHGVNIVGIITLDEASAVKRSGVYNYSLLASEYDIPIYKVRHINDASSIELLKKLRLDVICVIGWSQILSSDVLSCASQLVIGAHASLLPHNRGSAPINWAIINGERETGNSLITLHEQVDTGHILAQKKFDISLCDSCNTLYYKVAKSNADMLYDVLSDLANGNLKFKHQPATNEPLLKRRRPEDGEIEWSLPSRKVYDFIRALTKPYPGAFTYFSGQKAIVWKASWSPVDIASGEIGSVAGFRFGFEVMQCGVVINCGEGQIVVHELEIVEEGVFVGEALIDRLSDVEKLNDRV